MSLSPGRADAFPMCAGSCAKSMWSLACRWLASHPVSRRVFLFDAQTNTIAVSLIYDRKGELWKVALSG
jgi:hypothetical protein